MVLPVSPRRRRADMLQPGDVLVVVHDFDARSPDELTLRKAERLQLLELDDGFGDGWYLGRHLSRDATGLFPGGDDARGARDGSDVCDGSGGSGGSDNPRCPAMAAAVCVPASAVGHGPTVQRSVSHATLHGRRSGEDSPVMNETLSVINEHITDLRTPRQSLAPPHSIAEDSESDYSNHVDRGSLVIGPDSETDEQAAAAAVLTKEEVAAWDHHQVARHLRSIGVDARHCDIFEDQEISGEVLLDMDQSFIHMKDFDFGVMGRRLKTWHKIRDFQTQVRGRSAARQPSTGLPRIAGLREGGALSVRQPHAHANAPGAASLPASHSHSRGSVVPGATHAGAWRTSASPESPQRPSAGAVRDLSHSHRPSPSQSSLDFGGPLDLRLSSVTSLPAAPTAGTPPPGATVSSLSSGHVDLDRGYFSGNEVDRRKARNTLKKRDSASAGAGASGSVNSHQASLLDGRAGLAGKRHSRLSFVDSVPEREGPRPVYKSRFRSASARSPVAQPSFINHSPTVTNLENEAGTAASAASTAGLAMSGLTRRTMSAKALKLIGLRSTSEAVTSSEKETAAIDGSPAGTTAGDDGSHTPSATSQTFDLDNTDTSTRVARPKGPKTKQQTSAYQRGLLKMSPAEARTHCDHSGWMKKKSPSLVTTWKPRLFILRGRRLSYYYDEADSEERGIIDISGHKVLAANNDPVLSLHAALTGAKATAGQSRAVQFTRPTVHYFQCDSMAEGRKWMGEIMKATILHDLSSFETTNKQRTISLAKARERPNLTAANVTAANATATNVAAANVTAANVTAANVTAAEDEGARAAAGADAGAEADEGYDETDNHVAPATETVNGGDSAGLNIQGLNYQDKGRTLHMDTSTATDRVEGAL
ncbi:hypothetical protein DV737_g4188, partial [Chaetothyriales sp. CBS 132003]